MSDLRARAEAIHDREVVLDGLFVPVPNAELVARLRRGRVTTIHTTVGIFEDFRALVTRVLDYGDAVRRLGGALQVVRSVAEIEAARTAGRIGVILGIQNASPFEDDIRLADPIRDLGVRIVQLTYNHRNLVGDGCAEPSDAGLSAFGRRLVATLNAKHLLIDLSHGGERTMREAIDLSADPVVISHSNAKALCDHPRNASDDTIRAVAARGGLVGLNAFPGFVVSHGGAPTYDDLADHAVHIAGLVGAAHLGIGLDVDEPDTPKEHYHTPDGELGLGRHPFPPGFLPPWPWVYAVPSIANYIDFTECLLRRGFSDAEVAGIVGGNFLRVFRRVWGE